MKIYVVEALRWGDREKHSYVVGVFSDERIAVRCSHNEEIDRGGKYICEINTYELNKYMREEERNAGH